MRTRRGEIKFDWDMPAQKRSKTRPQVHSASQPFLDYATPQRLKHHDRGK